MGGGGARRRSGDSSTVNTPGASQGEVVIVSRKILGETRAVVWCFVHYLEAICPKYECLQKAVL